MSYHLQSWEKHLERFAPFWATLFFIPFHPIPPSLEDVAAKIKTKWIFHSFPTVRTVSRNSLRLKIWLNKKNFHELRCSRVQLWSQKSKFESRWLKCCWWFCKQSKLEGPFWKINQYIALPEHRAWCVSKMIGCLVSIMIKELHKLHHKACLSLFC